MLANDLAYALDPVKFAEEALGFEPDPWQAQALRWSGKRLLLNCSRQSGKSTTSAVLALHRALFYPGSLVLLISPSLRQSAELFLKVQGMLKELDEQPSLIEDNKLKMTLTNKSRILSLPGSERTIRGFSGASLIIEDEAARVADELYYSVRPMLAVSGGRIILMSTPFGKRGHFFHEWAEGGDTWERILITAHDCPRIKPEFLEEERQALGEWWFKQEYLCEFVETVDQVFGYDEVHSAIDEKIEPLFTGGAESA
jgi:hypothetical protein